MTREQDRILKWVLGYGIWTVLVFPFTALAALIFSGDDMFGNFDVLLAVNVMHSLFLLILCYILYRVLSKQLFGRTQSIVAFVACVMTPVLLPLAFGAYGIAMLYVPFPLWGMIN